MKKMSKTGIGLFTLVGLAWSLPAVAATRCVKPSGAGGCYTSIQGAIDASAAGDTVAIGAGVYYENVSVPSSKEGLKLLGASKLTTIIDPDNPHSGVGLTVNARGAQVANLQIRNGRSDGIVVTARDVVVRGVNVFGANGAGILVGGAAWNVQLLTNEIHNTAHGVSSGGHGTVVKGNVVTGVPGLAIGVIGYAAQVTQNRVRTGGIGIYATADGSTVAFNDVRYLAGNAILVSGSAPRVERNQVAGVGAVGITVACVDCYSGSVSWNTVADTASDGLTVTSDGPGLVVSNNTLLRTGQGLTLNGTGIQAQANRVGDPGAAAWAHCFEVYGEGNTLSANTAVSCSSAGFYVNGSNNYLHHNVATRTFENGFTVDGDSGVPGSPFTGNVLTANQATDEAGQGFAVVHGAANTRLIGNKGTRNRTDLCDARHRDRAHGQRLRDDARVLSDRSLDEREGTTSRGAGCDASAARARPLWRPCYHGPSARPICPMWSWEAPCPRSRR